MRVIVGTAAMLAVAAVFAVALGAILAQRRRDHDRGRHGRAALPVAALNVLPAGVGDWLLRVTPAAGLAVEQSIPRYSEVTTVISPIQGDYPLSAPGFALLACGRRRPWPSR